MRIRSVRLCTTVLLLTAAIVVAMTAAAFAAPAEPTLGLAALQAKLDASPTGSVQGYFKTVLKGSRIETIPVEVLSVTDEIDPAKALILFQAKGEKIAAIGGIASGMSGSPIYIDDEGVDKVIGAVSYGEAMSLGGTGLATPIEAMLRIQTAYAPRVSSLSSPVLVSGRLVDSIATGPGSYKFAAASGTFVGTPLAEVFVGGIRPRSALYAKIATQLEKSGVKVASIASPLSAGGSSFTTELEPGAAVGSLVARGAMWVGGFGTVTYVDGDTVLAYGHPALLQGATSMYLTNVWVTGVWPSAYSPYKMGYPTAVRGTFTQDRSAGVMGVTGELPAETPVFSRATDADSGSEAADVTYLTSSLLDSGESQSYVYGAASTAAAKLYDADHTPGSADTTTTVVVESAGETYTVVMTNVVDSSYDVVSALAWDADEAVYQLLSVLSEGIEHPHFVSVSLDARITTGRRAARIVDVNTLEPLHEGDNRVRVSLLAYGMSATQTVDATLTIPEGTALDGVLSAAPGLESSDDEFADEPQSRQSVSQIASSLNAMLPGNSLTVAFEPADDFESDAETEPVTSSVVVPWVTSGEAETELGMLTAYTSSITYGDDAYLYGEVYGPADEVEISIYGTPVDSEDESLLATTTAFVDDEGELVYEAFVSGLEGNTELRVHMDAGDGYTPADAFVFQKVRASVGLSSSMRTIWWRLPITFTARIEPGDVSGSVKFQYYDARRKTWRTIATKSVRPGTYAAKASVRWIPPRGKTKVRAVYGGSFELASGKSSSVTVTRH